MSKMRICSIYDTKAEAYLTPMFFQASGQAVRSFGDAVNQAESEFCKHPEDYVLFEFGEWDPHGGVFLVLEAPRCLARGIDLATREQV